jgi:hypothetical protein
MRSCSKPTFDGWKSVAKGVEIVGQQAILISCWRCAVSSSNSPRKRTHDNGGLGGKAQPNTTIGNPRADAHSPASEEEKIGSSHALRSNLSRFLTLLEHTREEMDAAFAGQPFLPNLPPDAPANQRRFYTYFEHHRQVTKLLCKACELWRLTF